MSELRQDPITGARVFVVPGRSARPNEHATVPPATSVSADCPFCEGNEDKTPGEIIAYRTPGTQRNRQGWRVRVVPNKFPALEIEIHGASQVKERYR